MKKLIAGVAAAGLVFVGLAFAQNQDADCVTLYVDYGPLSNTEPSTTCITVSGETNALDFLASAGLQTEGTQEYGNAVLCRVNNKPDASVESCAGMPPAEAYWAIIVKERQILPFALGPNSAWGWAQTGVNEIYVGPGDSIGLVFADNGEVRFP